MASSDFFFFLYCIKMNTEEWSNFRVFKFDTLQNESTLNINCAYFRSFLQSILCTAAYASWTHMLPASLNHSKRIFLINWKLFEIHDIGKTQVNWIKLNKVFSELSKEAEEESTWCCVMSNRPIIFPFPSLSMKCSDVLKKISNQFSLIQLRNQSSVRLNCVKDASPHNVFLLS